MNTSRPTLLGSISVLLWGLSAIWVRVISQALGELRAIIAFQFVAAIIWLLIWGSMGKLHVIRSALSSKWFYIRFALFCINVGSFFTAFGTVSRDRIPLVILLNYLWPTLTLLGSIVVVPIPVTRKVWFSVGCVIVLASLSFELLQGNASIFRIVTDSDGKDVIAYLFAILAALSWATYSTITRRWGEESGGPVVAPLFCLGAVAMASFLLLFLPQPEPHFEFGILGWILFGAIANITAFWCWDFGLRKGNVVILSLLADGMPWISLFAAYVMLGAPLRESTVVTAILLVIGGACSRFGTLPKRHNHPRSTTN